MRRAEEIAAQNIAELTKIVNILVETNTRGESGALRFIAVGYVGVDV